VHHSARVQERKANDAMILVIKVAQLLLMLVVTVEFEVNPHILE
jgi:hypothetical protein